MTQYPTAVPNGVPGMQAYNPIAYATPTPIPQSLYNLTPEQLALMMQQAQQQQKQPSVGSQLGTTAKNAILQAGAKKLGSNLFGTGAEAGSTAGGMSTAASGFDLLPATAEANAAYNAAAMGQPVSQAVWNAGATEAGGGLAGSGAGEAGSVLGSAAPYLGIAGAGLGAYGISQAMKNHDPKLGALSGAGAGMGLAAMAPLIGLGPIGWGGLALAAALGAGGGAGMAGLAGGRTNVEHIARSKLRDDLTKSNFFARTRRLGGSLDPSQVSNPTGTYLQLADGSYVDVSKEKGGAAEVGYNVDLNNPLSGMAIGWAQPIAALLAKSDDKRGGDLAGMISRAIMSNAQSLEDVRKNAMAAYNKIGLSQGDAIKQLGALGAEGALDASKIGAYANGINTMFAADPRYYTAQSAADFTKNGPKPKLTTNSKR